LFGLHTSVSLRASLCLRSILLLSFAFTLVAQSAHTEVLIYKGALDWGVGGIISRGDVLWSTGGGILVSLDISDPSVPRVINRYYLGTDVRDLYIRGSLIYLLDSEHVFHIVDITNPESPLFRGSVALSPRDPKRFTLLGDYALLGSDRPVDVIDIANPDSPTIIGQVDIEHDRHMVSEGTVLFVKINDETPLHIYDMADILNPVLISSYWPPLGWYMGGIAVDGEMLLVNSSDLYGPGWLHTVDVSDLASPETIGTLPLPWPSEATYCLYDIVISGDIAVANGYQTGTIIFDISDPASPSLAHLIPEPRVPEIWAEGHRAYLADIDLWIYDVDPEASLQLLGMYRGTGYANDIALQGDLAYVAGGSAGLRILDVSDPSDIHVANVVPFHRTSAVALSGELVIVGTDRSGIGIFDSSDPVNLTPVSQTYRSAIDLVVSGEWIFAASETVFAVVNLTEPSSPEVVYSCGFGANNGRMRDIDLNGTWAYVAAEEVGVRLFDVSDPRSPIHSATYLTDAKAHALAVSGELLFVGERDDWTTPPGGLSVVDVSDPMAPSLIVRYEMSDIEYVEIVAPLLCVAADERLRIYDASDPMQLDLIVNQWVGGETQSLEVSGERIFLTNGGIAILDLMPMSNAVVLE
jgi:hypothetical protein